MTTEQLLAPTAKPSPAPNSEQQVAIDAILQWLKAPIGDSFFVLRGFAGTGKTFSLQFILRSFKSPAVFTAPTNKATKVLRELLTTDLYTPDCCTIYSLLGLKLEANGEVKELKVNPEKVPNLKDTFFVVVDESSMLNVQVLRQLQRAASKYPHIKWLFMGDPAQLPPVGEGESPVWGMGWPEARLDIVMRHDNQILELVTRIRKVVDHPAPSVKLVGNFADGEGVWKLSRETWLAHMESAAKLRMFGGDGQEPLAKVIAWRNVTVDQYNRLVRKVVFGPQADFWLPGDRVIFTSPASDQEDSDNQRMASTDDEGTVLRVGEVPHPMHPDFKCHRVVVQLDGGRSCAAYVLHPSEQARFVARTEELAASARANSRLWKSFWDFKDAFHSLRHAYAITAHRSQGSTYENVFVDAGDILLNRSRNEAFRCLYVACSRPRKKLIIA